MNKWIVIPFAFLAVIPMAISQEFSFTVDDYLQDLALAEAPDHFIAVSSDLYLPLSRLLDGTEATESGLQIQKKNDAIIGLLLLNQSSETIHIDGKRSRDIAPGGKAYIPLGINGSRVTIRVNSPADYADILFEKAYLEKASYSRAKRFGFGADLPCHVDIHCPEGLAYTSEKKGVSRVFMVLEEGIGYCSGALMNNTRHDRKPYILSAFHCFDGYTPVWDEWRIDFGMESYLCGESSHTPEPLEFFGCSMLAGDQENDFVLLKLDNIIPADAPVAFLGWDRTPSYFPDTALFIHHPQGDLKKIAMNLDGLENNPSPIYWNNGVVAPANSHYKCRLDIGAYEGGSSGAPLMDAEGRVIGQLHGGNMGCNENLAYSGQIQRSWDGAGSSNRLKDWLDPGNSGAMKLDMLNETPDGEWVTAGGLLTNAVGNPIANARVSLAGSIIDAPTAADGSFTFSFFFNGQDQPIIFSKNDDHLNGVNILDLISVTKHILNIETYSSNALQRAADVTGDGIINVLDIVHIQKIILEIEDEFPMDQIWFIDPEPEFMTLSNYQSMLLKGYKLGDLNHSASTSN